MKKHLLILAGLTILLSAGFSISQAPQAHAADLSGWAWSSNVGWISFNSTDNGTGPGGVGKLTTICAIGYCVKMDTTGNLNGYAWSSNIGWISFSPGDIGNACPPGSSCAPAVNLTTGAVTGWAKVLSDGSWIELSGVNHPSPGNGVTLDPSTGFFSGYAFEPNEVGWLSFDGVTTLSPVAIVSCDSLNNNQYDLTLKYTATASGGSGDYDFSWQMYTGLPDIGSLSGDLTQDHPIGNSSTYTTTAPPQNYSGARLIVYDHNHPSMSAEIWCISKRNFVQVVNSHDYFNIGRTLIPLQDPYFRDYQSSIAIKVVQGSKFALDWRINKKISNGYTCTRQVIDSKNNGVNYWNTDWTAIPVDNSNYIDSKGGLITANVPIGVYTFVFDCTNAAMDRVQSSVNLTVINISENEF